MASTFCRSLVREDRAALARRTKAEIERCWALISPLVVAGAARATIAAQRAKQAGWQLSTRTLARDIAGGPSPRAWGSPRWSRAIPRCYPAHTMTEPATEAEMSHAPAHYQVGLDLRDRHCLVVGGAAVAQRKVEGLLEAGAIVTVVAPECLPMPEGVSVARRLFVDDDLVDVDFAVAATADRELNARIARLARGRGIWVNVADDPQAGTVILPAVLRRGALQIAISTGGASPALARRLRERLQDEFGSEYGELVALLGELRAEWEPRAIAAGVPQAARRAAWHAVLDQPLIELLSVGRHDEAKARAREELERALTGKAG